jgi:hypothetical protein
MTRPGAQTPPDDQEPRDPGAYIGHEPELAAERIPGGVQPDDERVAAHDSQVGPVPVTDPPSGHREADSSDGDRREAGQDR